MRAGATGREVDAVARDVIAAEGLGDLFGHGLGHGLGMEVHELPRLRPESDDVLAADRSARSSPASTTRASAGSGSRIS